MSSPALRMDTPAQGRDTPAERTGEPFTSTEETEPTLTRNDVVIAVMGMTGAGKSTFVSHFSSNAKVGHDLAPCTTDIKPYAARIRDQKCFLVDTPGFNDTYLSNAEVLQKIAQWFDRCYQGGIHLSGIVYLHRISDSRFGGSSLRNLRIFKKLCGVRAFPHVVIATTMWSIVSPEAGASREQELVSRQDVWGDMIKQGSTVMRQNQGETSAANIIAYILGKREFMVLEIQKEMASGQALDETLAGRELAAEFDWNREEYETRLREMHKELVQAEQQRNELLLEDLRDYRHHMQEKLDRNRNERERLHFTRVELQRQREMELLGELHRHDKVKLQLPKDDGIKDGGSPPLISSAGAAKIEDPIVGPGSESSITAQQRSSFLFTETRDVKEKDLEEIISSGDIESIQNLLETRFDDVAKGEFGWLQELKDLGYLENEIAELVLNIEKDSPWIYFSSKAVTNDSIMTQYHQPACVHNLTGELLDISTDSPIMPSTAAGVDSEVCQCPRSELPEKSAARGAGLSFPPLESSRNSWNTDENSINIIIEELCGLAGVSPHTRELEKWAGQVSFSGNETEWIASVTYALNTSTKTETPSYNENMVNNRDVSAIVDSDSTMQNIINVLERFCSAVAQSQKSGICCDSFTVLRKTTRLQQQSMIELTRIKICLATDLLDELKKCQAEPLWKSDQTLLLRTVAVAYAICGTFLGTLRVSGVTSSNSGTSIKHESMVDICSLAVQLLTVGFASYAQAHVDAYHPFFLDTPIHVIYLFGTRALQSSSPQVSVALHRFTCMDDMIQKPVMVFSQLPESGKSAEKSTYDLLATATDLIDTWGPGELIYTNEGTSSYHQTSLAAIWLGGGTIQASTDAENEESIILHWMKEMPARHASAQGHVWALDAKMRIAGGVQVNQNCEIDLKRNWSFFAESLENLGAYPGYWESTEFQAGLAISGQQFAGGQLQFSKTWTWHDGNTWKQNFLGLLAQELPLEELDRPWGLQVSFCTGVSRRVPLRVLIADVMPAVLNSLSSSPAWSTLKHHGIIQAFEGDDLKHWLDSLYNLPDPDKLIELVKRIVYYVLLILRDTGIGRTGKKLRIACLRDQDSGKPIKMCLEIPCEKGNLWARILADSKDCATFAYMTSLCLESDENKCQKTNPWHCPSLETAVCRYRAKGDHPVGHSSVWKLQDQALYWIGKPESGLQTRVRISPNCSSTKLYVSISTMSEKTLSRLGTMRLMSKLGRKKDHLREKQYEHWHSHGVLVSTDQHGSSSSGARVVSQ